MPEFCETNRGHCIGEDIDINSSHGMSSRKTSIVHTYTVVRVFVSYVAYEHLQSVQWVNETGRMTDVMWFCRAKPHAGALNLF